MLFQMLHHNNCPDITLVVHESYRLLLYMWWEDLPTLPPVSESDDCFSVRPT